MPDLEKCNFCSFGSALTLTVTLGRAEVTLVRICCRGLPTLRVFGVGRRTVGRGRGGKGVGRSSRARTATAGSLSAAADGPPEADLIALRRRGIGLTYQQNLIR